MLFVQPQDGYAAREMLLVPTKYTGAAMSKQIETEIEDDDMGMNISSFKPEDDIYLSLVHVALKLRIDLVEKPGHDGLNVNEESALNCIPDSLYMFLRLLYGGPCQLEDESIDEATLQRKIVCTAQDIIYGVSNGKKWTPKHIGLASTLHQITRSKDLVQVFNLAGHTLSYNQIMQVETALAENTLHSMNAATGTVIPPNLVPNRFVHFSADNIDILEETLNGMGTFHATQMAAWQRGPGLGLMLGDIKPSTNKTLVVPDAMDKLIPANMTSTKPVPMFAKPVQQVWYDTKQDEELTKKAAAQDIAFNVMRQNASHKPSWTVFNEALSSVNAEVTIVGYMPIIQAPAHEFDTLYTVVKRCLDVSAFIGQQHTVITVDQALYCKLMELKWCKQELQPKLVPRLGALHTSMNFLKVIGQHMDSSGLAETWIEAGIIGKNITEHVMSGKTYKKAMRIHKLTIQALWHILLPDLLQSVKMVDEEIVEDINTLANDADRLIDKLNCTAFQTAMSNFLEKRKEENVNFSFWWGYMEMVSILLMFTRAQRDGLWDLHLLSFTRMLPYFLRYDHNNYGRWGPVYLAEMKTLPNGVLAEFKKGNFVVKQSSRKFNQVDPDHAQEWLNGTGKRSGGITGITRSASALSRWALSFNLRSHIATDTRSMFGMDTMESHNEATHARILRDNGDEMSLVQILQSFSVFSQAVDSSILRNIATKDLATDVIQTSLLEAQIKGETQLQTMIAERLSIEENSTSRHPFYDTIKRNNAPTFSSLYKVAAQSKEKSSNVILKADRSFLQRLVTAYAAGRNLDLDSILKHELMPVPLSIAETSGSLRTGNKSILASLLTTDIQCPSSLDLEGNNACLVIDGQARVMSIGKPDGSTTFGNLADTFIESILTSAKDYQRVDVVFDSYRKESIKSKTRLRRSKCCRPIRRVIENRDVPLPISWTNYIALPANKADLAMFLSEELLKQAPPNKEVVVAGGFTDESTIRSSHINTNLENLRATHEEADTRLILHSISVCCPIVVVAARDTDVLLLLLSHFQNANCDQLWMMTGTHKNRQYIPIKDVHNTLPQESSDSLLAFHAITGCDTTSYFSGHTKMSAWKIFVKDHHLLQYLGKGCLTPNIIKSAESFICKMYGIENVDSIDRVRSIMFQRACKQELLPPTSDALHQHIKRAHYQSMVWRNAHIAQPNLPPITDCGWKRDSDGFEPILMTHVPIPESCNDIVACGCKAKCKTMSCTCRKSKLPCTGACKCRQEVDLVGCYNTM